MGPPAPDWAPAPATDFPIADKVLVEKGKRKLHLLQNGEVFRTFEIALGIEPIGHKLKEGDNRTPEGLYWLDLRKIDETSPSAALCGCALLLRTDGF